MKSAIRSLPEVVQSLLGCGRLKDAEADAVREIGRVGHFVNLAAGFAKTYEVREIDLDDIHRHYSNATYSLNTIWRELEGQEPSPGRLEKFLAIGESLRGVDDRNSAEEFVRLCERRLRSEQGISDGT